jgi:hypothetical protein
MHDHTQSFGDMFSLFYGKNLLFMVFLFLRKEINSIF